MSQSHIELIRSGYDAWNAGDRRWVLEHLSSEIEWATPGDDPDHGVYRGHDEVIAFWDQWRAAVGQLRFEIVEIVEAGSNVLAITKRSGTGQHSGLSVSDEVCQLFSFEGETCVRVQEFYDRETAVRAARLGTESEAEQRS